MQANDCQCTTGYMYIDWKADLYRTPWRVLIVLFIGGCAGAVVNHYMDFATNVWLLISDGVLAFITLLGWYNFLTTPQNTHPYSDQDSYCSLHQEYCSVAMFLPLFAGLTSVAAGVAISHFGLLMPLLQLVFWLMASLMLLVIVVAFVIFLSVQISKRAAREREKEGAKDGRVVRLVATARRGLLKLLKLSVKILTRYADDLEGKGRP